MTFTYCSLATAYTDNLLGDVKGLDNFYALETPVFEKVMTESPMDIVTPPIAEPETVEPYTKEDYTEACSCGGKRSSHAGSGLSEMLNLLLILVLVYILIYRPSLN